MKIFLTEVIIIGKTTVAMKFRNSFYAALTVLAAVSCNKDILMEPEPGELVRINISASSEATKAVVDNFSVKWTAGDQLSVFDDVDADAHVFSLVSGEGTGVASFTGQVSAGYTALWAVSPAAAVTAFSAGTATLDLPASQTVQGSCDPAALLAAGKNGESGFVLKNVGAVARFTISDDNVTKVRFEGNNSEKIAGTIKVNAETGAVTEIVNGSTAVEFTPVSGTFTPGTYEIVLLPADLAKGVTVTVTDSSNGQKRRTSGNRLNLVRNSIINLGDVCNGFVFSDVIRSFDFAETLVLDVETSGVSGISVDSITDGWSADLSQISSGKISVTAPAKGTSSLEGAVVLKGTNSKSAEVKSNTLALRIAGINSKADLLAFRAAHGGKDAEHTALIADADAYAASMAPYKVDGWVRLNADIEAVTGAEFTNSNCNFIHRIKESIDGDGHTIMLDVNGVNTAAILSFFQHIDAPVKNLNFAGQMTQSAKDGCAFASFAQQISAGVTVENVTSSVNMTTGKKDCVIGGLLSRGIAANGGVLKNSSYSGTITVTAQTVNIGGIVGVQANSKGEYEMVLDGCTFSGRIKYSAPSHNGSSRFGGIIGSQERNGVIRNCTNSGTIELDMNCTQIAVANSAGIGGIAGRCNALASGYTMSTIVKDCAFTGSIVFNNANPSQPQTYINKLIGTALSGYNAGESTGNTETGTIVFRYPSAKASFTDPSAVTFDFNQTEEIAISTEDAVGVSVKSAPEGWTVDCTNWNSGTISVTAPDLEAVNCQNAGFIEIEVEAAGGAKFPAENSKRVRMPGIYDAQDMIDFASAYGCGTDLHTTKAPANDISDYMIDGEIAITGDITIPYEAMYKGTTPDAPYWMVTLVKPLNGNGHTLTFNTNHATRGALIQDVMADIHDLNIAGTIKCTGATAVMGGLCCYISNDNITISNVKSSVVMTYSGSGNSYIGGLVSGQRKYGSTATKYTLTGCSFTGSITSTTSGKAIGGIVGCGQIGMKGYLSNCSCTGTLSVNGGLMEAVGGIYGASGSSTNPGEIIYLDNCSFAGTINYKNSQTSGNCRIGGIIGDLARGAELTSCTSSGNINVNMNNLAFASSTARGIGGIVGRNTVPTSQYPNLNAYSKLVDNSFTGIITVTNSIDSEENNALGIDQIVGRKINTQTAEESGSVMGGTIIIN